MTQYPIGTRCRIVRAHNYPEALGMEVTIASVLHQHALFGEVYVVDMREPPGHLAGLRGHCAHDQLEPIVPEGMAPARWEDCVWQPEHMGVPA